MAISAVCLHACATVKWGAHCSNGAQQQQQSHEANGQAQLVDSCTMFVYRCVEHVSLNVFIPGGVAVMGSMLLLVGGGLQGTAHCSGMDVCYCV